ncbi:hypothetical protein [Planctomycetes bacterium CA13]|uniref:hypothetical protein n=1 Tax=Novipirellula herctigrandis TaxID=2527986 RepID=UPI0011B427E7
MKPNTVRSICQTFMYSRVLAVFSSSIAGTVSAAEHVTYADRVGRLTDLERLATPVVPGEKTFASTSHDRSMSYDPKADRYQNGGANNDGGGSIRHDGKQQVMVDLEGPGVLWRIWSARADRGHVKIFLDGSETPIIDKPFAANLTISRRISQASR